ncbi:MAG: hypothetical protein Q9163_004818 [Psora crenata]
MYGAKASLVSSLLLAGANTLYALPSPPSPPVPLLHFPARPLQQQANLTLTAGFKIHCFDPTEMKVVPVDLHLCALAIDNIIQRDGPEAFMKQQTFYFGPNPPETCHIVPDSWYVKREPGSCEVIVSTGAARAEDVFRLSDIAILAQVIVDKCATPIAKQTLGGLGMVGNNKGFFVAVNGKNMAVGHALERYGVYKDTLRSSEISTASL